MIPLILIPVAVFAATALAGIRMIEQQRPRPFSIVSLALGLITFGIVVTLAYRQGIIADETGGTPPSNTPLVIAGVGGLVLIAMGALTAGRRPGSH